MNIKVLKKQENSKMCFVCGLENTSGLKAEFFELENDMLMAVFNPTDYHQSYKGRLHGGLAVTILEETIGRAILMMEPNTWGVTIDFSVRFRKPVPLEGEIRVIGRINKSGRRSFEGTGEILTSDGEVAIEGSGKYLKMDLEKITDYNHREDDWQVVKRVDDPESFSI